MDLAQNAAGLHAGKHLFQPAHIGGKVLHLAKTLIYLFQLVIDRFEALSHPFLQGILQLLVHGMPDLVQLLGVLGLQGGQALGKGAAHLFQLTGIRGFQPLQPLLHGLLLTALPGSKGSAHTLHRSLQRLADLPHSGKVLLRHLCQFRFHLTVLRIQLLAQPFLQFRIAPAGRRLCRAVEQQRHHQADGHQQHRVKKCQKFHFRLPLQNPGCAAAKPGSACFLFCLFFPECNSLVQPAFGIGALTRTYRMRCIIIHMINMGNTVPDQRFFQHRPLCPPAHAH